MADARVGQTITETITLLDFSSPRQPILGATFSVDVSRDPQGNPFTPVFAEVGSGAYTVTVGPFTLAGDWYLLFHSDDATNQSFEGEWLVAERTTGGPGGITRGDMRRAIATDLADYRALTATDGSTTTLTDPLELLEYEDTYVGADVLFTSGSNSGQRRRVTASTMATQTITFNTDLPHAVVAGDTADLYNIGGRGFRLPDYDREISRAIDEVKRFNLLSRQSDPLTFAYDSPAIALPADWIGVYAVTASASDPDCDDRRLPAARYEGTPGWFLRPDGFVVIGGSWRSWLDGLTVTLSGYQMHPDLATDDDLIYANQEWLRLRVKANLLERKRDRDAAQWSVEFANRANALRPLLKTQTEPNTRLLPR